MRKAQQANTAHTIAEVFESSQPYSLRRLDSLAIDTFLTKHPEYQRDSSAIRNFYRRRGMQFAWVVGDSLSGSADAFVALADAADTLMPQAAELNGRLSTIYDRGFADGRRIALCDSCATIIELHLTAQFFRFADHKYGGQLGIDLVDLGWFIPRRKKDPSRLLDSLAKGHMDLAAYEPVHPQYQRLKSFVPRYHRLASEPWPALGLDSGLRKVEPGDSLPLIGAIRHRLYLLGDLATDGGSQRYDSMLVDAVQRFQTRHGLHPDGIIGKGFLRAINVPIEERMRTMLVNMERLRWVPEDQARDLLLVNIPEFRLHVFEQGREVMRMDVVVGTSATRTVIFSDSLSEIVFSPSWTIPRSITRDEILPAMRKDPNYLQKKNMEIIGGSASNPVIRQKPGADNALGRVKFLFPNSYSIYMHDTPAKSLFGREQRAFSHGCIRLSEPGTLAEYLLRDDPAWTTEKIQDAMLSGTETVVRLKMKRQVTIGYFTAWVDGEGLLNFREDVYGHDERLESELFIPHHPTLRAQQEGSTPL